MNRNQRAALANPNLEFGASTFLGQPVGPKQMLVVFADREAQEPYEKKILLNCPDGTPVPPNFTANQNLTLLVLPSNINDMIQTSGAFASCPMLETVVGIEDLETITEAEFANCPLLKVSRLNATIIGPSAFTEDIGLERVELTNVEGVENDAFFGAINATIVLNDNVEYVNGGAFEGIDNLIYHGSLEGAPWGATKWNGVPQN